MICLDTSVLVRYLVQDDPAHSSAAGGLVDGFTAKDPGFVSVVAAVETYWVLRRAYRLSAAECSEVIAGLLAAAELRLERSDLVRTAVQECRGGGDFADALVAGLGLAAGCAHTVTFDRRASGLGGMRLLSTAGGEPAAG